VGIVPYDFFYKGKDLLFSFMANTFYTVDDHNTEFMPAFFSFNMSYFSDMNDGEFSILNADSFTPITIDCSFNISFELQNYFVVKTDMNANDFLVLNADPLTIAMIVHNEYLYIGNIGMDNKEK
jgi:hypothetical protein